MVTSVGCYPWLIRGACVILLVSAGRPIFAADASADADLAVVRLLEAHLRANLDGIRRWSGSFDLTDGQRRTSIQSLSPDVTTMGPESLVTRSGDFWEERHVLVRFAVDLEGDALFTTYEVVGPTRLIDRARGTTEDVEVFPVRKRFVVTGDHWLQADAAPDPSSTEASQKRGAGINSGVRSLSEESQRYTGYSWVVDPREMFYVSGRTTFADAMKLTGRVIEAGKKGRVTIRKAEGPGGDIYTLRQEFRADPANESERPAILETTFDPASGYNPTRSVAIRPDGSTERDRTWAYTAQAGLFIPAEYGVTAYAEGAPTDPFIVRRYRLRDSDVNEAIDEKVFTWDSLGLTEGDQIHDKITGETLRFSAGRVIPAARYAAPAGARKAMPEALGNTETPRTWTTFAIINCGFLALLAVLFAARKGIRRRA